MDSTGVIPPPSVTSPPAPEIPKVPQKPSRKPKGREPPPRPKSRPVSELTLGTDEQDEGPVSRDGDGAQVEGNTRESKVKAPIVPPVGSPVVPPRKMPEVKCNTSDTSGENSNPSLDDKSELSCKEGKVKDDHAVKKPVPTKPTVVGAKAKESTQDDRKPSGETEGVKETKVDSNPVPVEGATTAAKKIKPTVIIAPKPAKKKEPEAAAPKGKDEGQELSNEKPSAVTGGKPPPPAKKPKPPVKAKPASALGTPGKPSTEENKPDTTVVPKARLRPTVIAPKMNDAAKPDEESSKSKEESQARLKPTAAAAPVEANKQTYDEEKSTLAPSVKSKRGPTIIRAAPRLDVQDAGEERKPPRRPQRGPSIRAPPRRPVSAPADGDKKQAGNGQDEPAVKQGGVQEKAPRPPRPVSIPGVKENETLKDTEKLKKETSPVEELTAMTRKGSRKRPPPPRPPTVEPVGEKVDSTLETKNKTEDVDDKSKARTRPPPPRPPAVENASDKEASAPEMLDQTAPQDSDEKSEKKNRPPRPASKVLEDKPSKHLHGEAEKRERETQEKPKPVRPAPVAPNESSVTNKNVHEPETRTVAESTCDDHVQETTHAREESVSSVLAPSTAEIHEEEKSHKASSKAKPKPARPPSVTSSTKKKPHRPSAPVAK